MFCKSIYIGMVSAVAALGFVGCATSPAPISSPPATVAEATASDPIPAAVAESTTPAPTTTQGTSSSSIDQSSLIGSWKLVSANTPDTGGKETTDIGKLPYAIYHVVFNKDDTALISQQPNIGEAPLADVTSPVTIKDDQVTFSDEQLKGVTAKLQDDKLVVNCSGIKSVFTFEKE